MTSAGELLHCERLKRNRSLSEIASETCISTRYLQAIEDDNQKILPGDFFYRSFVRQYARALGLGEAETRRILDAVGPAVEIDPIPLLSIAQQIADVEQSSKPLAYVSTRIAAMLLFVVLAGCSGLYALWNRAQEAADPAMHVLPPTTAPPRTPPVAVPASDVSQIDVNLAAKEKTWVSLSSEGKTVYSGVIDPSQSKHFAIPERAHLFTDNAAGLDLSINGHAVGPLGPRGQVRVVLLTQDDFEILPANKM